MKIDRITYSESIEVMEKKWIKTGAEGQLTDDEDPAQAMADLKIFVREAIKKDYEDLQLLKNQWNPNWDHHLPSKELPVIDRSIERLEILIDDCKTVEELGKIYAAHYEKLLSNESLSILYNNKFGEINKLEELSK